MRRSLAAVAAATAVISALTVATREGFVPLRVLAATPESVGDGRIWLLATSALVADRPAAASIAGFAVVGLAAFLLCEARVVWIAAIAGHICSAALVYAVVTGDRHTLDYGTSAIVAAWVGVIAAALWPRTRTGAVALCVAAALLGWYFKGTLTLLDTEHAVALAIGAGLYRFRNAVAGARWRSFATRGTRTCATSTSPRRESNALPPPSSRWSWSSGAARASCGRAPRAARRSAA